MSMETHPKEGGEVQDTEEMIREKILHVLSIYPRISMSMLQVGVGTSLPPVIWKSSLAQLIKEGKVIQTSETHTTPTDRNQSYTILSLPIEE